MPRLEYDVVFNLDQSSLTTLEDALNQGSSGGGSGLDNATQQAEKLSASLRVTEQQAERAEQALNGISSGATKIKKAGKNVNAFSQSVAGLGKQAGRTNKQFAGANQTVFAFSDLIQDSTQFTQGFSQGMRAIGNNVAFAGELFGQLQQRVRSFNESLSEAQIAAGKQRTVMGELRKSMGGVTGAIIAMNVAVIAQQAASQALTAALKPLKEEAKGVAEAFSEVASTFSEFETGITDPFGIRARSREIKVLQDNVEELDLGKIKGAANQLATLGTSGGRGLVALSNALGIGQGAIFDFLTATGQMKDDLFISLQANTELRKEIEKQIQTREAYNRILENNKPLKDYVDLTREAEKAVLDLRIGTNESSRSLEGVYDATIQQINALKQKEELNESEIGLLFRLIELRGDAADELISERKIERETRALRDRNNELRNQIDIASKDVRGFGATITQGTKSEILRSFQDIYQDIQKQRDKFNDQLLQGEITKEQFRTRIKRLETQERLRIEEEATKRVTQLHQQAQQSRVNAATQATQALRSINQNLLGDSKAMALGILALEKALAISEVIVDTTQKAAAATATGAVLAANPATAALAPNAYAQAAKIKTSGAIAAASIAAQGLAEGAGILSRGGGGGSSGGATSQPSQPRGFFTEDVGDRNRRSNVAGPSRDQPVNVTLNVSQKIDKKGLSIMVKDGNKELKSKQKVIG